MFILFTLYTNDCTGSHPSTFSNDTATLLDTDTDISSYSLEDTMNDAHHLIVNTKKGKVDF